ncbi:MAG TPA: DUF4270 family protein, partial [Puia sp.]|nr:DUF4270 family protein [Puia sp.]
MTSSNPISRTHTILLSSAITLFLLGACVKPTINFGTTFVNNNNTNIVVIDSFTTQMSTVYVDSFPTAGTGTILVGRYKDNAFGLITSRTFYQMAPPVNIPTISNQAVYDSLVLITRLNRYFYGDTTVTQTYHVSQLNNTIQLPGIQTTFYSKNSVPFNNSPLGSATLRIYPHAGYTSQLANDSVKFRLPDANGQELFNLLQTKSPTVTNTNSFLAYFRGLTIYPDDNSTGAVYGFKDTVIMRVFFHEPGVIIVNSFTDFTLYNKAYQWNNIVADRTGTPLQQLASTPQTTPGIPVEISSDSTGHAAYVQSATSMQVKIKFPWIWKLQQLPDFVSVLKADLIVTPVSGSYDPLLALPPRLEIFQTDDRNLLLAPITLTGAQYGNLIVDYVYGINTNYTYDLTNYIKTQLVAGADNNLKNGVMLVQPQPDYNTTLN